MKRLLLGACILATVLVAAFVVFVAGLEFGHRWGYDEGCAIASLTRRKPCTQGEAIFSTILSGSGMVPRIP